MGLWQAQSIDTPQIPDPIMHSFSSKRHEDLRTSADVPFKEEATFWNPSWTRVEGAVQIKDITDFSKRHSKHPHSVASYRTANQHL
jgi:hypothetical protein